MRNARSGCVATVRRRRFACATATAAIAVRPLGTMTMTVMTTMTAATERSEPSCARCGGDAEWFGCETCGGEGVDGHDCGEDTCCCLDPEENQTCDVCLGRGGWWRCANSPEWCQANPLPGQEAVERGVLRLPQ